MAAIVGVTVAKIANGMTSASANPSRQVSRRSKCSEAMVSPLSGRRTVLRTLRAFGRPTRVGVVYRSPVPGGGHAGVVADHLVHGREDGWLAMVAGVGQHVSDLPHLLCQDELDTLAS